jgi:hypothetical protein
MALMTGRPSLYSEELAERICDRLMDGESLRTICLDDDMPSARTVHKWLLNDLGTLVQQYTRARTVQAHLNFEEAREIVETDPDPVRARLRFDQRRWAAGKLLPKVYGERVDTYAEVKTQTVSAEPMGEDEWNRQHAGGGVATPKGSAT